MVRKGLASAAAAAVLALGSAAWADTSSSAQTPAVATPPAPMLADDTATAPMPLMSALDNLGIGNTLTSWNMKIGGFVEAGYYYDTTDPRTVAHKSPPGDTGDRDFFPGAYKNSFMLNQADLDIERDIDASKGMFDVGFKVEAFYGRDAFFTHSDGILDTPNKSADTGPTDQLDLVQAYLNFALPVEGLSVEAGKFVTPFSYETINPTNNQFYTHSYNFSYGVPATQTGVLGHYMMSDKLSVSAGVTRAWNASSSAQNDNPSFLGGFVWGATDDQFKLTGNLAVGAQDPSAFVHKSYAHNYILAELEPSLKVSDELTLAADALWGYRDNLDQWGGVAAYAGYNLDPKQMFVLNGRVEWFDAQNGFTLAGPHTLPAAQYYEATVGVAITPMPDDANLKYLKLRPEARYDWSDHRAFDVGNPGQLSVAMDVIYQF